MERNSCEPIRIKWLNTSKGVDKIVVLDLNQCLSYFSSDLKLIGTEKTLEYIPTTLCVFSNIQLVSVGYKNGVMDLWTFDGVKVSSIELLNASIKSLNQIQENAFISLFENGSIEKYTLESELIHSSQSNRLAIRENMTEIVIHHLGTHQKARIRCRDLIQHIALKNNTLGVSLVDKIIIYESDPKEENDLHYKMVCKIPLSFKVDFFVLFPQRVLVVESNLAFLIDLKGKICCEWDFGSKVSCLTNSGGPNGRESCFLGLVNGSIVKIFMNTKTIIPVTHLKGYATAIQVNLGKSKIAIIDEVFGLIVYDLILREILFKDYSVDCVKFSTDFEDFLCYSTNGSIKLKYGTLNAIINEINGDVIYFSGCTLYYLESGNLKQVDVSFSPIILNLIQFKRIDEAYSLACVGMNSELFESIGKVAIEIGNIEFAKKCAYECKNLVLIDTLSSEMNFQFIQADVKALNGDYASVTPFY